MPDTVKLPFVKQPVPRWGLYAGLGAGVVLIVVEYRKNKAATAGSAAAPGGTGLASGGLLAGDTTSSYPWDGTYGNPSDPFSMDSSTGQTYGNEGYLGGFGPGGALNSAGTGVPGPPFSSNAAWSAYALQQLTQTASFDPNSVAEALGLYLDGQDLDRNQQDIVYAAQAVAGQVPVPGRNGYPPKLRIKNAAGDGHKGGTKFAHNPVSGLRARVLPQNSPAGNGRPAPHLADIEITWDKSDHAAGYQVSAVNTSAHRTALAPVTTATASYVIRGLPRDTFEVTVLAKPAEKGAHAAKTQVKA